MIVKNITIKNFCLVCCDTYNVLVLRQCLPACPPARTPTRPPAHPPACLPAWFFNRCRHLPETKRHSSLFLHWSGSKYLVAMAVCTPPIHGFLERPLFLLFHGIHSIINCSVYLFKKCPKHFGGWAWLVFHLELGNKENLFWWDG